MPRKIEQAKQVAKPPLKSNPQSARELNSAERLLTPKDTADFLRVSSRGWRRLGCAATALLICRWAAPFDMPKAPCSGGRNLVCDCRRASVCKTTLQDDA